MENCFVSSCANGVDDNVYFDLIKKTYAPNIQNKKNLILYCTNTRKVDLVMYIHEYALHEGVECCSSEIVCKFLRFKDGFIRTVLDLQLNLLFPLVQIILMEVRSWT